MSKSMTLLILKQRKVNHKQMYVPHFICVKWQLISVIDSHGTTGPTLEQISPYPIGDGGQAVHPQMFHVQGICRFQVSGLLWSTTTLQGLLCGVSQVFRIP